MMVGGDVGGWPVMICSPVAGGSGLPGASRVVAGCGHEVWLSRSGSAVVAAQGGRVVLQCVGCVVLGPSDEVGVPSVVYAELAGLVGCAEADRLVALAASLGVWVRSGRGGG